MAVTGTDQAGASRQVRSVVVGVSGGIAAYKACELVRLFTESGHDVVVVPTKDALRFVGEATWAALSGNPVTSDAWERVHEVPHIRIARTADLVVVVPATADLLARVAHGLADDLLTLVLLAVAKPVMYAPAMHTEMWEHPATQANVQTLRRRNQLVLEPAVGRLTGADTGPGRLPDPDEIFQVARRVLARGIAGVTPDLTGRRVVISAGGTREFIDPVRFIGNRSSGRQGYALARTAVARGADVTVVAANVALPDPAGAKVVHVTSAEQLRTAVLQAALDADAVVMAAAVADFRPARQHDRKIKKTGSQPDPIEVVLNPDVLVELSAGPARSAQVMVGFAAETENVRAGAVDKLRRKGCDIVVANQVGDGVGFESEDNAAVVVTAEGTVHEVAPGPKEVLADAVWDLVVQRWSGADKLRRSAEG